MALRERILFPKPLGNVVGECFNPLAGLSRFLIWEWVHRFFIARGWSAIDHHINTVDRIVKRFNARGQLPIDAHHYQLLNNVLGCTHHSPRKVWSCLSLQAVTVSSALRGPVHLCNSLRLSTMPVYTVRILVTVPFDGVPDYPAEAILVSQALELTDCHGYGAI